MPRFQVGAWFNHGGNLLVEWPTVDIDEALKMLKKWRRREGLESVAGAGILGLGKARLSFGGFVLDVAVDGSIEHLDYKIGIRAALVEGVFPQWKCDANRVWISS